LAPIESLSWSVVLEQFIHHYKKSMRYITLVALALACLLGYTTAIFGLTSRKFYVAGTFRAVQNQSTTAIVGNVASFDGNIWNSLNGGTDSTVNVVHVDSLYNIYIGGGFSTAGGVNTGVLAVWKRGASNWAALGGNALTIDPSITLASKGIYAISTDCATANTNGCDVYIGGIFQFAASDGTAVNVAKWSSSSSQWQYLGGTGSCSGSGTTCTGHQLIPNSATYAVYAVWKKEASCAASVIGSYAGVACNVWIGGAFPQQVKLYNSKTSLWSMPSSTQVSNSGSSVGTSFQVRAIYYQSYLIANDEVYIAGKFDFADDGSNNARCQFVCKITVTGSNSNSGAIFTFTSVGSPSAVSIAYSAYAVQGYYSSYTQYALSTNPTTIVYAAGLFASTSSTSNALWTQNQITWQPISSTDVVDIGTNLTVVNAMWTCGPIDIDCSTGSVVLGGQGQVGGYVRYYNTRDSSWNTFGGPITGIGANVQSVDSAESTGTTTNVNFSCVAIVFLAMVFVTLF